ncbi:Hint domain-containing protein [Rhodovulum tesquicola]|uniref:Hint domain-containing protein n=1 Tax=Rhodovulum tesquicola TaxID=540254 RepID=UPI0020980A1C|nr:Hint domain-containing protein [Rhodovulum tesquicola]MCO8145282.1 Hint domain-containing protein [Rhodovulum tesquicola]
MATYTLGGYAVSQFLIEGGGAPDIGARFMLEPDFVAEADRLIITVTDDDGIFHGSANTVLDNTQSATITNAGGDTLASGDIRLGYSTTLSSPAGGTITVYQVLVNGTLAGYVADGQLEPGVTYLIANWSDTLLADSPDYNALSTPAQDPEQGAVIQGGIHDDRILAGGGNDSVDGGDGNDTLDGGDGDDTLHGGAGDDYIAGQEGNDFITGGTGNDTIFAGAGDDFVEGGDGDDIIHGNEGNDTLHGEDGNDRIYGDSGNDVIHGGAGHDTLEGGDGNDLIHGGEGDDSIDGNDGDDTLYGGAGNDVIEAGAGNDLIHGEDGDDFIHGRDGNDTIIGGAGNDMMLGGEGSDLFIIGHADGLDTLIGSETGYDYDSIRFTSVPGAGGVTVTFTGAETGTYAFVGGGSGEFSEIEAITGTDQADTIDASANTAAVNVNAGAGNDSIIGGSGNDFLEGEDGNDTLIGGAGNDALSGGNGDDLLLGGEGNDTLFGGWGNDTLDGGEGDDYISAFGGNNLVLGGAGNDTIVLGTMGAGNDTIIGGAGDDRITTGGGSDLIVLDPGGGWDTVTDFDMTMIDGQTRDQLDGATLLDQAGNPVRARDVTIEDDGAGNAILVFPSGEKVTLLGVTPEQVAPIETLQAMGITCIGSGTRIDTPDGPRPVETLREGDAVLSWDARGLPVARPILFAAARRVEADEMTRTPRHAPIEIAAGALGPHGRLWLSRQHAVRVGPPGRPGWLARAGHLADLGVPGVTRRQPQDGIGYHHLMLDRHALIRAEGLTVESFWPGPRAFAAFDAATRLRFLGDWPALARAALGLCPVDTVYGPMVLPLRKKTAIDPQRLAHWARKAALVTA